MTLGLKDFDDERSRYVCRTVVDVLSIVILGERQMNSYRYDAHLVRRTLSSTDKMSVVLHIAGKFLSAARLIIKSG